MTAGPGGGVNLTSTPSWFPSYWGHSPRVNPLFFSSGGGNPADDCCDEEEAQEEEAGDDDVAEHEVGAGAAAVLRRALRGAASGAVTLSLPVSDVEMVLMELEEVQRRLAANTRRKKNNRRKK